MNPMRTLASFVGLACLLLAACTPDQITTTLELAVDAATAAAPAIEQAANVSPATAAQISEYLTLTSACLDSAQSVLGSGAVTAAAAAQITDQCAQAIKPVLPPGTPVNVITAVQAVDAALSAFLAQVPKTTAFVYPGGFSNSFMGAPAKTPKIDKKRLARIHAKVEALKAKLKK